VKKQKVKVNEVIIAHIVMDRQALNKQRMKLMF